MSRSEILLSSDLTRLEQAQEPTIRKHKCTLGGFDDSDCRRLAASVRHRLGVGIGIWFLHQIAAIMALLGLR